jgi:hypothetical protein
LADACTGQSAVCPDAKRPNTFPCRPAAGECDVEERCDGVNDSCPAIDGKKPSSSGCTDDGNPCTTDACDGMSNSCQHPPGNAGTQCRPSNGDCDLADTCSGTSALCPDSKRPSTYVCRPAPDACDLPETCTGTSDACPSDVFKSSTVQCRAPSCTSGTATLAANCTGSSAACPAAQTQVCPGSACSGSICAGNCTNDAACPMGQYCSAGVCTLKLGLGKLCNADGACTDGHCVDGVCCDSPCNGGICDSCTIVPGTCTAVATNTVCRPAVGECDVAEVCGGGKTCPADVTKDGQACSSDGNVCTTDVCAGAVCSHVAAPAETVCRPAAGECDAAETCGGATVCPQDKGQSDGTSCTDDGNPCTSDVCTAGSCQHPAGNKGAVCRVAAGDCDLADTCDGTSTMCTADLGRPDDTPCSGDGNVCTVDSCHGGLCVHVPGNAGAVCREAVGECDSAESCDGISAKCPPDGAKPNGTDCSPDANPCTQDICQLGTCTHPAGNAMTICRPAATLCDVAEQCDGASPNCPPDGYKSDGTACVDDGKPCTSDQCRAGKCSHTSNDGTSCEDGNVCTKMDTCSAGLCAGMPVIGCTCMSNADCDDKNVCNGVETCVSGACKAGTPLDCDDKNECTEDGCAPATGCLNPSLPDGAPCSDGLYCTIGDQCKSGVCTSGKQRDCGGMAQNLCQGGACDESKKECVSATAPDGRSCNDDNACTADDKCTLGSCAGTPKPNCRKCNAAAECNDDSPCTVDLCNDTKTCVYLPAAECADGGLDGGDQDAGDGGAYDADAFGALRDAPDDGPSTAEASSSQTYAKPAFGPCTCRFGAGSSRTPSMAFLGIVGLALRRVARRARRSRR